MKLSNKLPKKLVSALEREFNYVVNTKTGEEFLIPIDPPFRPVDRFRGEKYAKGKSNKA